MSCPVGKSFTIHTARNRLTEAFGIHKPRRSSHFALSGGKTGSLVTLPRHHLPFLERRVLGRFGFLPFLNALRPAHFGSLIARVSNRVVGNCREPAFLLGEAEDMIVNPVFQSDGERTGLDCFWRECFRGFEEAWTSAG